MTRRGFLALVLAAPAAALRPQTSAPVADLNDLLKQAFLPGVAQALNRSSGFDLRMFDAPRPLSPGPIVHYSCGQWQRIDGTTLPADVLIGTPAELERILQENPGPWER